MKVTVVRGGGLAGTVLTISVDSADLDEAEAAELRARVDAADLRADRPRRNRPDGVRVEVNVVGDDGDPRDVRFDDHDAPDGAADLVRWVLDCPSSRRTRGR